MLSKSCERGLESKRTKFSGTCISTLVVKHPGGDVFFGLPPLPCFCTVDLDEAVFRACVGRDGAMYTYCWPGKAGRVWWRRDRGGVFCAWDPGFGVGGVPPLGDPVEKMFLRVSFEGGRPGWGAYVAHFGVHLGPLWRFSHENKGN